MQNSNRSYRSDSFGNPTSTGANSTLELQALLKQNLPVILICFLSAIGLSLALTLRQAKQYDATAKLVFKETSADSSLVGVGGYSTTLPAQTAAAGLTQVKRSGVIERTASTVGQQVGGNFPGTNPASSPAVRKDEFKRLLRRSMKPTVETDSNLVAVRVRWTDGMNAAKLANLIANETADMVNSEVRRDYAQRAAALRTKLAALPQGKPGSATRLARTDTQSQITKLSSLATLAEIAAVASRAEPTNTPSVPKPLFTAILAGLGGLFVGLVISLMRRALDKRIHSADDLEQLLDQPVLGVFPESTLGIAGPLVNDTSDSAHAAIDCARILRQNLHFMDVDNETKLVVITSAVEAEGKSTVASSLAVAGAAAGDRVLLIDADLRRPVISDRFAIPSTIGLMDHLAGDATLDEAIRKVSLHSREVDLKPQHVSVMSAGRNAPHPADVLDSDRFRDFIREVSENFDFVVIDTAPLLPVPDTSAVVPLADAVVLCCRLDDVKKEAFSAARERLQLLDVERVALAATGGRKTNGGYYGYGYDSSYGGGSHKPRRGRRGARDHAGGRPTGGGRKGPRLFGRR